MAKIYGNTVGAIKIIDGSGGRIIEVAELPTENIDESAVYAIVNSDIGSVLVLYRYIDGSWVCYSDTSDATATAAHILKGATAYANGVKITGVIETYEGEPSLTTHTVEDNESGGQTYTITSASYITDDSDGSITYTIGG